MKYRKIAECAGNDILEIITEEEFYRAKRERDRRRRKENSPVYGVLFCLLALGTPFLMVMMWLCGIG